MSESLDKIYAVMRKTAKQDPFAVQLMNSQTRNNVFEKIATEENNWPSGSDEDRMDIIMEGMKKYLKAYNAPPAIRQKHWKTCQEWVKRIAVEWGNMAVPNLSEYIVEPLEQDSIITLIKALHSDEAKTKAELQKEVGVTDKTIQNDLRALCPGLQESGKPLKPFRIAGQEIRAEIIEETVARENDRGSTKYKGYRMPNRLHPVFLQMSTIQAAHVLMAMQKQAYDEGDVICHEAALDIWSQLSPEGKYRIREVYCNRAEAFKEFIEDVNSECTEGWIAAFHSEEELHDSMDTKSLLESAFKCGIPASLTLDQNGERIRLRKVRIRWGAAGGDEWLAIPEDEWPNDEHAVVFSSGEIHGQIELHQ